MFYTPYIYFPIDDRRQSGFLPPSFSSTSDTGFTLVTPYYFNLAPNYDATLYPRYMAKRGMMLEGEFRYLTHSSEGMVTAAYLNDKDDHRENFPDYSKDRWLYGLKNTTGLDSRWLAEVDYTRISDPYYFQDLNSDLQVGSTTYVNQQGALTYRGDTFTARLNAQSYQLATTTDITPYDRLPQITFNGFLPYNPGGLKLDYSTEFVRFDRDLDENVYFNDDGSIRGQRPDAYLEGLARATGDRMHLEPGVSLPMTRSWGYLTPTLKYLYTKYDLDLDSKGKNSSTSIRKPSIAIRTARYHWSRSTAACTSTGTPASQAPSSARPWNLAPCTCTCHTRTRKISRSSTPANRHSATTRYGVRTASQAATASATPTSCPWA